MFSISASGIKAILLDIEGTTTPLSFVHEVLFPYARQHTHVYLTEHFDTKAVQDNLLQLMDEHTADCAQDETQPALVAGSRASLIDSITAYIFWLMDRDRKSTGLKSLQGKIWEEGYKQGTLVGQVFPDVPIALNLWQQINLKSSIFSSGSVLAQKLLFAHTEFGDLTPFLYSYYDTTTGAKSAVESYSLIATTLELAPSQVLFISDTEAELAAARESQMSTLLCLRPGNRRRSADNTHSRITSFDEIAN